MHVQAVKSVKGILNKLTPENFDKLLEQLKATITTTEILHGSITLVFESAVAQPTFVNMYAELCVRLSKVCRHGRMVSGQQTPVMSSVVLLPSGGGASPGACVPAAAVGGVWTGGREAMTRLDTAIGPVDLRRL